MTETLILDPSSPYKISKEDSLRLFLLLGCEGVMVRLKKESLVMLALGREDLLSAGIEGGGVCC